MSQSEDIVIVDSSDYAQVVFEDVNECYTNAKPLECEFTLNELLKSGEGSIDWIGIYKVGFSDCSEYVCNLPIESATENKGKVVFPVEVLPKEEGEFYQFVYVSNGKQIRGASVPFQFKFEGCTEYSDEEDNDAVIVKLEGVDTITDIKNRCVQLSNANQAYEKLVRDNEALIKTLKDEVASIKLRCFRLTMDNEKLNFTLRNKADSLKNLAETISSLTKENNSLQDRFNDLSNDNKNLLGSLQERIEQVAALKKELESAKISKGEFEEVLSLKQTELLQLEKDKDELSRIVDELHLINATIQKLEDQVTERTEELDQIKADLRKNNVIVAEQAEIIQTILAEKDDITRMVDTLKTEINSLESSQANMGHELDMTKDKLTAAEECKEMLRGQLEAVTNELEECKKKMTVHCNVANELTGRLAQTEYEKCSFNEKLTKIKEEYEEKFNQLSGSYYVLRVAHNSLETRLKSSEQKRDMAEREAEIQKDQMDLLRKENEELKDRVRCGAYEYTKLFEKFRLVKNQKFNNELNVYHDLSSPQDDENKLRRRSHITSIQSSDSHDQTGSQMAQRTSEADSQNTLLDALLGTSFYNGTWNNQEKTSASACSAMPTKQYTTQPTKIHANLMPVITKTATISQPKSSQSQSSDLSDDGLVQAKNAEMSSHQNLSQKLSRCQIGISSQIPETKEAYCEECGFMFPTGIKEDELAVHMNTHFGQTCPVCFLQFEKGYSQKEFEFHVDSHFSN